MIEACVNFTFLTYVLGGFVNFLSKIKLWNMKYMPYNGTKHIKYTVYSTCSMAIDAKLIIIIDCFVSLRVNIAYI